MSGVLKRWRVGRYYDPATGQFLNVDPLVDVTGQPYAYTGDDPNDETDPTGLYGRIGRIASASAYGYFVAFNHVTTGNKQAVKPGMVRRQFQLTAQAAAPSTAYILAAIKMNARRKYL